MPKGTIIGLLAVALLGGGFFLLKDNHHNDDHDHSDPDQHIGGTHGGDHEMHFESMTREEIAEHATVEDCYVGYKKAIYNITDIIAGNEEALSILGPTCGTIEAFTDTYTVNPDTMSFKEFMEEKYFVALLTE